MSTPLKPVITDSGITALFNAKDRGVKAKITHVAVGDGDAGDGAGPYEAASNMTALKNEIQRTIVAGGELLGSLQNQLHLTATVQDRGEDVPNVYPIYEIGFFLETGELFAIYASTDEKLAEKVQGTDFVLAFDLTLTGADAGDIEIDGTGQLNMPIARDNLLVGENIVKIHTQEEFDRIFNQGNNTQIPRNATIVLSPIQNTTPEQSDNLVNGASGGMGDDAHNTYNGRPAYILKNSLLLNSRVNIIGFNQDDTIVVKGVADANIKIIGHSDFPVTGVKLSGWSFDGRGGIFGLGGNLTANINGSAIYLERARQCQLDCKIINHRTTGEGGGIYGLVGVKQIIATHVQRNMATFGGGVYGCNQSTLTVYECLAQDNGSGVYASERSNISLFDCEAANCFDSISYHNNGTTTIGSGESNKNLTVYSTNDNDGIVLKTENESFTQGIAFQHENFYSAYIRRENAEHHRSNLVFSGGTPNEDLSKLNDLMVLNHNGDLGVGTNEPVSTIHGSVEGDAKPSVLTLESSLTTNKNVTQGLHLFKKVNDNRAGWKIESSGDGGSNAKLQIRSSIRGNDTSRISIMRNSGFVGIGNSNPSAMLDVNGDTSISGKLNVASTISVNGEKPFIYKRYTNLGDSITKDTGKSISKYIAVIAGFNAKHGNIDENRTKDIIKVFMMKKNDTWHIRADFMTHGNNENWDVDVLFINKLLVEVEQ